MQQIKQDLIITLRKGTLNDLNELQELFVETVRSICSADYNKEQITVWTASVENTQHWNDILTSQTVLVAQSDDEIVGFASLENMNYIDLFYVHKDYQKKGIARKLYIAIEEIAIQNKQTELQSDVSITAKPFFEKFGFIVKNQQKVVRHNIELTNFRMTKKFVGNK